MSDEDGPDDKPAVIVDDDDSDIDAVSDVDEDDKARVEEDEEARREKIRAKKKLKQEKKLKKKMSDASEKAVEKSVEDRHASPVEPLGGVVPDDAVGIIHNAKYPAYHLFARDVYAQKLFRSAESRSANATPDHCIRRFRVKASDADGGEVRKHRATRERVDEVRAVPPLVARAVPLGRARVGTRLAPPQAFLRRIRRGRNSTATSWTGRTDRRTGRARRRDRRARKPYQVLGIHTRDAGNTSYEWTLHILVTPFLTHETTP